MTKSERFLLAFAENVVKRTNPFSINDKKSGTCQRFVQDRIGDGIIVHGWKTKNDQITTDRRNAKYEMAAVNIGGILYVVESYFQCKIEYVDGLPSNVVSFEKKRDEIQNNINSVILPRIYAGIDAAPLSKKSQKYVEYAVRDYLAGGQRCYRLSSDFSISDENIACILCNLISQEKVMEIYLQAHRNMFCEMKGRYILEQKYLKDPDILNDWERNLLQKIMNSNESSVEVELLLNGQSVVICLDWLIFYFGIIEKKSFMSVLYHDCNLPSLCKLVRHYGVSDGKPVLWGDVKRVIEKAVV